MLQLFAAIAIVSQPATSEEQPGATSGEAAATIFSTVGQSEWCPAGNVKLDLNTGRYEFKPRAPRKVCNKLDLKRRIKKGSLEAARLEAIREAFMRAESEGLDMCADGARREEVVVTNGGKQILVLGNGEGTTAAPDDLACWSEAAQALHTILEDTFRSSNPL